MMKPTRGMVLEKLETILANAVNRAQNCPNERTTERVEKARSALATFRVMPDAEDPVAEAISPSLVTLPTNTQAAIRKVTKVVVREAASVITQIGTATAVKDAEEGENTFKSEDLDAAENKARVVVVNAVKANSTIRDCDEACNKAMDKLKDLGVFRFIFEAAYRGTRAANTSESDLSRKKITKKRFSNLLPGVSSD